MTGAVEFCIDQVEFCIDQVEFCVDQVEFCAVQVELPAETGSVELFVDKVELPEVVLLNVQGG